MLKKGLPIQGRHSPVPGQGHFPPHLRHPRLIGGPEAVIGEAEGEEGEHGNEEQNKIEHAGAPPVVDHKVSLYCRFICCVPYSIPERLAAALPEDYRLVMYEGGTRGEVQAEGEVQAGGPCRHALGSVPRATSLFTGRMRPPNPPRGGFTSPCKKTCRPKTLVAMRITARPARLHPARRQGGVDPKKKRPLLRGMCPRRRLLYIASLWRKGGKHDVQASEASNLRAEGEARRA